ncbi:zona pellucida sperm-binding protein 1 [Acridotheres tristis]
MGRSCSFLLLLFLLSPWPRATVALLQYRHECGELGMQLLVLPSHGRTVRFKVLDEFGSRFDVANCSICLHWLNSREDGSIIFSSGYNGCHVLFKENRYILRVQLEELLSSGIPVTSYEVNMTCPKPGGSEMLPDGKREQARDNGVVFSHTGLHQVSESSLTLTGSHFTSQDHLQQVHTVAQYEPDSVLPGIQHNSNPAHSGLLSQPGGVHPVTHFQGSFIPPGVQPLQPGGQSQTGILHPVLVSQSHPSFVHPGGQTQPGHLRPGSASQNQPGMMHPGGQNQPGIRPGSGNFIQALYPKTLLEAKANQGFALGLYPKTLPGDKTNQGFAQHLYPKTLPGAKTNQEFALGLYPKTNQEFALGLYPKTLLGDKTNQEFAQRLYPKTVLGAKTNQEFAQRLYPKTLPGDKTNQEFAQRLYPKTLPGDKTNQEFAQRLYPKTLPGAKTNQEFAQRLYPKTLLGAKTNQEFAQRLYPKTLLGAKTNQGFVLGLYLKTLLGAKTNQGFVLGFAALAHPGLSSWPGYISSGIQVQPQPGLGRPGLRPQPGLLHPGINSQPSLLESTALFYPSAGAGMPLTREQCQVPVGRMPCVAPEGREGCLQAGCCYNDMDRTTPCYYGNTVTVQCLLEGYFVLVVPRGMVDAPYNLDSVRLASSQAGCEPLHTSEAFVMFRFPVTHCGTTVQVMEDRLIYENHLISTIDVQGSPRGSITRDSVYILHARCIYNSSDLLPLGVEVAAPPTAAPLAMPGPLGLQLRIATDESYSSYHPVGDFPLVRVLRDPIYVEVRLLQKTDPNLVLVLHHCWASPGPHATSQPQWPILVEGCPFQGDNYKTQLIPMGPASPELPFPSHYQRFVVSTFTFVEPPGMAVLEGEVYISCSASVCHLAQPEPCRPSCQLGVPSRVRRSPGDRKTGDSMRTVTSQGCIVFPEAPKRGRTQQRG